MSFVVVVVVVLCLCIYYVSFSIMFCIVCILLFYYYCCSIPITPQISQLAMMKAFPGGPGPPKRAEGGTFSWFSRSMSTHFCRNSAGLGQCSARAPGGATRRWAVSVRQASPPARLPAILGQAGGSLAPVGLRRRGRLRHTVWRPFSNWRRAHLRVAPAPGSGLGWRLRWRGAVVAS